MIYLNELPIKDTAKSQDSNLNLSTFHSKVIEKFHTGRINEFVNPSNLVRFYHHYMFWFETEMYESEKHVKFTLMKFDLTTSKSEVVYSPFSIPFADEKGDCIWMQFSAINDFRCEKLTN